VIEMKTRIGIVSLGALAAIAGAARAEPTTFEAPEAAVEALVAALEARDRAEVLAIFGPENEDVASTDDADEDRAIWGEFLENAKTRQRIEESDGTAILYVGREAWPFPAPLVRGEDGWSFDAEAAREEVLMRRIGRNELEVIDIMNRAAEVQAAYRRTDHDRDGVMEFAAAILSSPGARDGLYWPETPGAELSPFDDQIALASLTGVSVDGEDVEPEPYEGYYFHILQGQGDAAPGGAYSYLINGNMVAGHALLAVPALYGDTGIMSFLVGENGIVYEADLGEETLEVALGISAFNPDDAWRPLE
jgi:hypothetical protein